MCGVYNCCICKAPEAQIHEVFFGRGVRRLSIEYNLRVPLCEKHHNNGDDCAHTQKEYYIGIFCEMFEINEFACKRALENHKYSRAARRYLNIVRYKLDSFLEKYLTH